ncbi:RHS domain-containing protein [Acidovorax sp. NPDC077693]|uniref:RHS domain-containing protein n=1 Tax=unclassified Acidovorax TaxID=2684926 RepID=UPI0037C94EEA
MGLPEELSNAQGQLVWQAQYKTWGSTVEGHWEARRLHGAKVQGQNARGYPGGEPTRAESAMQYAE